MTTTMDRQHWSMRLKEDLEPVLSMKDPRAKLITNQMPSAIFWYPETEEFAIRPELRLLAIRLQQNHGKRVTFVSLAELLEKVLAKRFALDELFDAEKAVGLEPTIDTVFNALAEDGRLDDHVVECVPPDADPLKDIIFVVRAGALYPVFRVSPIIERLMNRILVPLILFYPGRNPSPAGLSFMGVHDPDYGYRAKIF